MFKATTSSSTAFDLKINHITVAYNRRVLNCAFELTFRHTLYVKITTKIFESNSKSLADPNIIYLTFRDKIQTMLQDVSLEKTAVLFDCLSEDDQKKLYAQVDSLPKPSGDNNLLLSIRLQSLMKNFFAQEGALEQFNQLIKSTLQTCAPDLPAAEQLSIMNDMEEYARQCAKIKKPSTDPKSIMLEVLWHGGQDHGVGLITVQLGAKTYDFTPPANATAKPIVISTGNNVSIFKINNIATVRSLQINAWRNTKTEGRREDYVAFDGVPDDITLGKHYQLHIKDEGGLVHVCMKEKNPPPLSIIDTKIATPISRASNSAAPKPGNYTSEEIKQFVMQI